jgi:hypothetical protein
VAVGRESLVLYWEEPRRLELEVRSRLRALAIWLSKSKLHDRPLDYGSSVRREEAIEYMPRGS